MTMNTQKIKLDDLLIYEQPTKYIVKSSAYSDDESLIPVLTAGKTFILGYTKEKEGVFPKEKLPVIIFDDFTTATKYVDFQFKVKSSAMKILHVDTNKADPSYLFYVLQSINFPVRKHKRHWISEYSQIVIDLPAISKQKEIANELRNTLSLIDSKTQTILDLLAKQKELFTNLKSSVLRKTFKVEI
jgi:restriction endonuclease S subunit